MAKRFTFNLEGLFKLRCQQEQLARGAFYQACGEAAMIELQIEPLERTLTQYNRLAREVILRGRDQSALGLCRGLIEDLQDAVRRNKAKLAEADQVMQQRRVELAEAIRKRKALSRLKSKLAARHDANVRRRSVKEADDVFAARAAVADQVS